MNEKLYKIFTSRNLKINRKRGVVFFNLDHHRVAAPKVLGDKILKQIKRKQYSLIRQMIDIYKDELLTNF